jgi:hypothetical protein
MIAVVDEQVPQALDERHRARAQAGVATLVRPGDGQNLLPSRTRPPRSI